MKKVEEITKEQVEQMIADFNLPCYREIVIKVWAFMKNESMRQGYVTHQRLRMFMETLQILWPYTKDSDLIWGSKFGRDHKPAQEAA